MRALFKGIDIALILPFFALGDRANAFGAEEILDL
jgi:hypothetical protein